MPKIELSLTAAYQPKWGVWEGLRELVSNAKDAEAEHGAKAHISYKDETLRIVSEGVTLPTEALLLGHTTKADRTDTIGRFGEGFKIGILALVRSGCSVKIRNGSEVWTASIARSAKFNADVLTFDVSGGRKAENRVAIEVAGLRPEAWDAAAKRFLWLTPPPSGEVLNGHSGSVILTPALKGSLYVRGVFVRHMADLQHAYDVTEACINRDRDVVDTYMLRYTMRQIWDEVTTASPEHFPTLWRMLEADAEDTRGVNEWASEAFKKAAVERFKLDYGEEAVPVANAEEKAEAEALGKKGVPMPQGVRTLLKDKLPTVEKLRIDHALSVRRKVAGEELDGRLSANLLGAVTLLKAARPDFSSDHVDVVEFVSDMLDSRNVDGRIFLSLRRLESLEGAIVTLAAEYGRNEAPFDAGRVTNHILQEAIGHLLRTGDPRPQEQGAPQGRLTVLTGEEAS